MFGWVLSAVVRPAGRRDETEVRARRDGSRTRDTWWRFTEAFSFLKKKIITLRVHAQPRTRNSLLNDWSLILTIHFDSWNHCVCNNVHLFTVNYEANFQKCGLAMEIILTSIDIYLMWMSHLL